MINKDHYERLIELIEFREGIPYWRKKPHPLANRVKLKNSAGHVCRKGYRHIGIRVDGVMRTIEAHRLVWYLNHGNIPSNLEVDHIDRNRDNNRIDNLRLVTRVENMRNTGPRKGSKSKYKGVSWFKKSSKWRAVATVNGISYSLGLHENEEDAARSYDQFCIDNNLTCAYLNFPNTKAK